MKAARLGQALTIVGRRIDSIMAMEFAINRRGWA
jgi:hypothetical protein